MNFKEQPNIALITELQRAYVEVMARFGLVYKILAALFRENITKSPQKFEHFKC